MAGWQVPVYRRLSQQIGRAIPRSFASSFRLERSEIFEMARDVVLMGVGGGGRFN
jgi:hypothetical protein